MTFAYSYFNHGEILSIHADLRTSSWCFDKKKCEIKFNLRKVKNEKIFVNVEKKEIGFLSNILEACLHHQMYETYDALQ